MLDFFMKLTFLFTVSILIAGCGNNPSGTYTKDDKIQPIKTINGETLLKENCNSCHKCYGDMVGPELHGSFQRWDTKENLIAFVQNSEPVLKTNKYAAQLKKKYGLKYIHHFNNLDSNQIKVIMYACDSYQQ
jgi:hypothetical protein